MNHVTDRIAAFVAGETPPAETRTIRNHLAACPACREEVAAHQTLWSLLDRGEAPHQGPASVWPGVRQRTIDSDGGAIFGLRGWARTGLASGALAMGLLIGVLAPGAPEALGEEAVSADWLVADSSLAVASESWTLENLWLDVGALDTEDR